MKPYKTIGITAAFTLALGLLVALGFLFGQVKSGTAASIDESPPMPALDIILPHTLTIEPAFTAVSLGHLFTVNVVISDIQNLGGAEYTLAFSPSVVLAARAQLGDFPGSTGRTVVERPPEISNTLGTVEHGFFSFGAQPGPDGRGIIASVVFTAAGYGTIPLDLTAAQTTDTAGGLLTPTIMIDGLVTVPCTDTTGVELTLLTMGDVFTDTLVEFSADIIPDEAVKPYSYTIDFGGGTAPVEGASSDDPLAFDYTFVNTGTYTVEIGAWNCEMTEPITDTVVVEVIPKSIPCAQVTGVDLMVLNEGDIYTNTLVEFSADIMPDDATKPYSYTIDFGDGTAPVEGASSDDPLAFDYTYVNTGTYTVEIGVWNCGMAEPVTDAVSVTIVGPPEIDVTPEMFEVTLEEGGTTTETMTIENKGAADLIWNLDENPNRPWLAEDAENGTLAPGESDDIVLTFDAAELVSGTYTTTLDITSNDPNKLEVYVSVTLTVTEVATPTVTILTPTPGQVIHSLTAVSVTVEVSTTNFVIGALDDPNAAGHWHLWVDGADTGPVFTTMTEVLMPLGTHVIMVELRDPSHTPLGIFDEVTITVEPAHSLYLPLIVKNSP